MAITLDPWGHFTIEDYGKLIEQFGMTPIESVLSLLPKSHHFFHRKIVFGHRDLDVWLKALKEGGRNAVLTGFMPSGHVHLGHLMVIEELKYFQEHGAQITVVIADAEAYAVRKVKRDQLFEYSKEYISYALAAGLDPYKTKFYFQTNQRSEYYRLIHMFSRKVTTAEMEAIYGSLEPAKVVASLTQAADILHLQLEEYGGFENILVPVGADQDPHIRLTRDLADRFSEELKLKRPSSMYHKFTRGLDGNKMSSSRPEYAVFLSDPIDVVKSKVMKALTGGRATAEEQRELGGEPWKCTVFDLYSYYLVIDDRSLKDVYNDCVSGRILCGECKLKACEKLVKLIKNLQELANRYINTGLVDKVIEYPSF